MDKTKITIKKFDIESETFEADVEKYFEEVETSRGAIARCYFYREYHVISHYLVVILHDSRNTG